MFSSDSNGLPAIHSIMSPPIIYRTYRHPRWSVHRYGQSVHVSYGRRVAALPDSRHDARPCLQAYPRGNLSLLLFRESSTQFGIRPDFLRQLSVRLLELPRVTRQISTLVELSVEMTLEAREHSSRLLPSFISTLLLTNGTPLTSWSFPAKDSFRHLMYDVS